MKNRKKRTCELLVLTIVMTAGNMLPVFAASWQQEGEAWRWKKDDGSYQAGGWQWLDGNQDGVSECYFFDANGYMLSNTTTPDGYQVNESGAWMENGTVKTKEAAEDGVSVPDGRWMKGNDTNGDKWWWQNADGSYPAGTWQWLDGNQDGVAECYYFDSNGWAITSGQTPDGYQVDADGKWMENQAVKTKKVKRGSAGPGGNGSGKTVSGGGGSSSGGGGSHSSTSGGTITDDNWENYSDDSVSGCANDLKNGNKGMMSSDQWNETKEAIEGFKSRYLSDGMSDFEKEIKIIEWLVENCSYEKKSDWSRSTAYSCIVLGKAQCSGYADAFLQTTNLCGLEARYVFNSSHAWNMIKLDGDWYHVDVTWEDPIGDNNYGFGNLRNSYINLEDDKIRNIAFHKTWNPSSATAHGIKYGPKVVKKYLAEGVVDTSVGTSYKEDTEKFYASVAAKEGSLILQYTSVNDTVDKIVSYLSSCIDRRDDTYTVLVRFGNAFNTTDQYGYKNASAVQKSIVEAVNSKISAKYSSELKNGENYNNFYLSLREGSGKEYYAYWSGYLFYEKGHDIQLPYTIHYIADGKEIGTQSGQAETGTKIELKIPDGYKFRYEGSCIQKGEGYINASMLQLSGKKEVEAKAVLVAKDMVPYTITYKEKSGKKLDTVTGTGMVGTTITPENKTFDGYELVSAIKSFKLINNSNNIRVIEYRKIDANAAAKQTAQKQMEQQKAEQKNQQKEQETKDITTVKTEEKEEMKENQKQPEEKEEMKEGQKQREEKEKVKESQKQPEEKEEVKESQKQPEEKEEVKESQKQSEEKKEIPETRQMEDETTIQP